MSEHFHIIAKKLVDIGKKGGDITDVSQELLEAASELKWPAKSEGLASTDEANWALDCALGLISFWSLPREQRIQQRETGHFRKQKTVPEYLFDY